MSLTLWQPPSSEPRRRLLREDVYRLFDKMAARWGAQFVDKYSMVGREVMADEWAEELSQFTGTELARGLSLLKTRTFPPSLPEFAAMCRPPIDPEVAYHEATTNMRKRERGLNPEWTHPAIFWAAVELGSHDLRVIPYKDLRTRWIRLLERALEKGLWEPVPKAAVPLPAPDRGKPSPEVAAKLKALADSMRMPKK